MFWMRKVNSSDPIENGNYTLMAGPTNIYNAKVLRVVGAYFAIFLIGFYGNTSVLSYILFLTRSLKQSVMSMGTVFVYVLALCVVDSLVILSMPFTVLDILLGQWIFGSPMCKLYWVLESASKVLSTLILTALGFERYIAICQPRWAGLRTMKSSLYTIFACVLTAIALLSPLVYKARAARVILSPPIRLYPDQLPVRFELIKCIEEMSMKEQVAHSAYTFLLAFCVPAVLITVFYWNVVFKVARHQRKLRAQSRIPTRRVAVYTAAVTCFYFLCWTPYWIVQIYLTYAHISGSRIGAVFNMEAMYAFHALPYVNSALNWIFYARLNTQFRKGLRLVRSKRRHHESVLMHELDQKCIDANNVRLSVPAEKNAGLRRTSDMLSTRSQSPVSS